MNTEDSSNQINQPTTRAIPPLPETAVSPPGAEPKKELIKKRKTLWLFFAVFVFFTGVSITAYLILSQNSKAPEWQGITPGASTEKEVVTQLGSPKGEGEVFSKKALYYDSGVALFPNTVVLDSSGKVSSVFVQVSPRETIKFSEWVEKYGRPEKEMYNHYMSNTKTYLFPGKGVAVVANHSIDQIFSYQYFKPISLEKYLRLWGQNLSEKNLSF